MTHNQIKTDFFLGSMTPEGFCSYFDALTARDDTRLYLIKSGPGCGKSTLMKRLGQKAACDLERIHCSSDPDSLDGLLLKTPRAAILDATAPHTLEPEAPGAKEEVVSLFHTLNAARLYRNRAEILFLFRSCSQLHDQARHSIAGAAGLLLNSRRTAAFCLDFDKLNAYAARLSRRLLPKTDGCGRESLRLLSAVTPKGILCFGESIPLLADHIVVLQDDYGAASRVILDVLRRDALARGHSVLTCPCGVFGRSKLDHLIFPELRLAVVTSNPWHPLHFAGQKTVRCKRFFHTDPARQSRVYLRFNRRTADELFRQASTFQLRAKGLHDQLEAYYRAAVDFSKVDATCADLARRLEICL